MGKRCGRRKDDDMWRHVEILEEKGRWKCRHCKGEFSGGVNRIRSHIKREKGKGIRVCPEFDSEKEDSRDLRDNPLHSQQGQIPAEANSQEIIQVRSSSVSDWEIEDSPLMRYVLECLSPEDKVFVSPFSCLTQAGFITLKPGTPLDPLVIDIFVEMLNHAERKSKTPSNWYLPVTFSKAALEWNTGHFLNFVHSLKLRENYMSQSDLKCCEKIFIPVHDEAKSDGGRFYLYVIHLKNKEIEIWDSLPDTSVTVTERDETTKKLLLAMEKLFVKVPFRTFRSKTENDILLQRNRFDCGIFVVKSMEQSDNYVKRNLSFQFDSKKERKDLAIKLLISDLNQKKQNLHDKARRHYAQVEKQDGLEEGSSKDDTWPTTVMKFQSYSKQIWKWIMNDEVSTIGIWGIRGSGKIALLTHIRDKLLEKAKDGIKVIWVTGSQNIDIHELQKVIAKFDEPRAFKEMKKCVIVLDDVMDHFSLKDIGFPMSDNRIKLILTTRFEEVCQGMNYEKVINVESLDGENSWVLFDKFCDSIEKSLRKRKILHGMWHGNHDNIEKVMRVCP